MVHTPAHLEGGPGEAPLVWAVRVLEVQRQQLVVQQLHKVHLQRRAREAIDHCNQKKSNAVALSSSHTLVCGKLSITAGAFEGRLVFAALQRV